MNYALITGASSGIGYELTLLFAGNRHNLILVARQKNKLIQLADNFKKIKIDIPLIPANLSENDVAEKILRHVQEKSISVNYLVNNPGFS
jgi:uncharacterized protein